MTENRPLALGPILQFLAPVPCLLILAASAHMPRADADEGGQEHKKGETSIPAPDGVPYQLGSQRFRHPGPISVLRFSGDGRRIVTAGADGVVRIWDRISGQELRSIPIGAPVRCVAMTPDDKRIAVAAPYGKLAGIEKWIELFDIESGKVATKFKTDMEVTVWVAIAPDGGKLYSFGMTLRGESIVRIFDMESGARLREATLRKGSAGTIAIAPDGKTFATGDWEENAQIWNAESGTRLRKLAPRLSDASAPLVYSPDGSMLAGATGLSAITVWETGTGKVIRELAPHRNHGVHPIESFTWSPDGRLIAVADMSGKIRLWDAQGGTAIREWFIGAGDAQTGKFFYTSPIAFSPDGKVIATTLGGNVIRLWDPATGRELHGGTGHRGEVLSLAFSPDGRFLASGGGDAMVLLWDVRSRKQVSVGSHHSAPVRSVVVSPDGRTLATGGEDDSLALLDVPSLRVIDSWALDLPDEKPLPTLKGEFARRVVLPDHIQRVAFSPSERKLVVTSSRGSGFLVDYQGGRVRRLTDGPATGGQGGLQNDTARNRRSLLGAVFPENPPWRGLAYFAAGGEEVFVDNLSGGMDVYDSSSGEIVSTIRFPQIDRDVTQPTDLASCLSVGPRGSVVYSGDARGRIRMIEASTWLEIRMWPAGEAEITALAISPNEHLLASADARGDLRIWDVREGTLVKQLGTSQGGVLSLAFSPDGKLLASGGLDSRILVWAVTGFIPTTESVARPLGAKDLEGMWKTLADSDAKAAHEAVHRMIASPQQSLPFLARHLRPTAEIPRERVERVMVDLNDDSFAVRERAEADILGMDLQAKQALLSALQDSQPLEVEGRIGDILRSLRGPPQHFPCERVREVRAVAVLEKIGDPAACEVLGLLSSGAPSARQTREAKAALERLEGREEK